jgi:hypothetical protein
MGQREGPKARLQRLNQHIGWATDTVASFVPAGEKVVPAVAKPAEAAPMTGIDSQGLLYVGIAFAAALLITVMSRMLGKGLVTKEGADKAVFH